MEQEIKELIRFKIWLGNNPRLVDETHRDHVLRFKRINVLEAHSERSEGNEKVCVDCGVNYTWDQERCASCQTAHALLD